MSVTLPFLAFNDVYRVRQKYVPQPGTPAPVPVDASPEPAADSAPEVEPATAAEPEPESAPASEADTVAEPAPSTEEPTPEIPAPAPVEARRGSASSWLSSSGRRSLASALSSAVAHFRPTKPSNLGRSSGNSTPAGTDGSSASSTPGPVTPAPAAGASSDVLSADAGSPESTANTSVQPDSGSGSSTDAGHRGAGGTRTDAVSKPTKSKSKVQEQISVSQFAELIYSIRDEWATQPDTDEKEGLVLFAGDVFSPSVDSSVTRGSHMVPVMNALKVDAACVGNHDFDFGYPHMTKLIGATTFPWMLSNVVDINTGHTPEPLHRFWVTEKCGVKIGLIGLVEEDWIATIPSWPENFHYKDMVTVALELSKELRDPEGEYAVDIIIALTHCRVPNDIQLAEKLGAVTTRDVSNEHGVDLIIGGHDHIYYIGKGATSWEGWPGERDQPGTEEDHGALLIKSGTDFRDLSSASLELSAPNDDAVRRRVIVSLTGKHHYIVPSSPANSEVDALVDSLLQTVTDTLAQPIAYSLGSWDARSEVVRTRESSLGNWIADVLLHAYDESLLEGHKVQFGKENGKENGGAEVDDHGADAVIICGGTLRGDSQYGPGRISLGDLLEILPFDDAIVAIELDGKAIWDTMESALSRWPAQEGRFPIVAGMAVEWDSQSPPGERVKSIRLIVPSKKRDEIENPGQMVDGEVHGGTVEVKANGLLLGDEIPNESGGRIYRVITRQYMAEGFDGFEALKGHKFLIDDETGQTMSSIIRSFLLGSAYIFRHKQLMEEHQQYLSRKTLRVLQRARRQHQSSPFSSISSSPTKSVSLDGVITASSSPSKDDAAVNPWAHQFADLSLVNSISSITSISTLASATSSSGWGLLRRHIVEHDWLTIREALHIARTEHMSMVDACQGDAIRRRRAGESETPRARAINRVLRRESLNKLDGDVPIVCPLVDGRMKDTSGTAEAAAA